ncbi:bile acid:sodium symporter family protein [Shinella sp. CPCC 101442]|uniref:bile acid:sodium symporter family protein n=1 Tax=Shinella sp. CPCC 101442 TaxID=2932265 RepID=UPI002153569A|nr:bile acid:sodium symporter family protein [Shinella sp. CPCC 101442]MCR6498159.1 bile acid:sodium symporter family protein [Shinella sp. CPCC 101442]
MEQSALIDIGLPAVVFIIMAGIGMTLSPRDFERVATRPKALIWGITAALIILPVLGLALAVILDLPRDIAIGLVITAACPIGTTTSLFSYLARGDVALSIALSAIGCLVAIATLPLFANFAIDYFGDGDMQVHLPILRTIGMMLLIILFPVMLGMGIRRKAPGFAARAEKLVAVFGVLVLVALIIGIGASVKDRWVAILVTAGPAVIGLTASGIAVGLIGSRLLGLSSAEAITVALSISIRNAAIGMVLAITMMRSPEVAVPPALFGLLMYASGFVLLAYGRRKITA